MSAPVATARRTSVRTALALVSAAVTSMVAIAFLIPLAVIVRDVARDRAFTSAQLAGAGIEPVLAVTTDQATLERAIASTQAGAAGRLTVHLSAPPSAAGGGTPRQALADGTFVGGPQRASAGDLRVATTTARSFIAPSLGHGAFGFGWCGVPLRKRQARYRMVPAVRAQARHRCGLDQAIGDLTATAAATAAPTRRNGRCWP